MFVAMNRLTAPAEFGGRIEQGFSHSNMQGVAGFINFKLLKLESSENSDQVLYVAMTTWEDRPSYETWQKSDAFAKAHSGPNSGSNSPLKAALETFEVILDR